MQHESFQKSNVAPGTFGPFNLLGGTYQLALSCTGTPACALQQRMPDAAAAVYVALYGRPNTATPSTYINSLVTEDVITFPDLPPGEYQVVLSTSTANYFTLTRVPLE